MGIAQGTAGREEMRDVLLRSRTLFVLAGVFSLFANLLLLTGPLYMLQVYDRVLSSGSDETLVALTVILVFLYVLMGVLDFSRLRITSRIAARFQDAMDCRVFEARLRKSAVLPDAGSAGALHDLDAVRRLLASTVVTTFMDLPWTPIFFGAIFFFHPYLGALAIAGAVVLVLIALANQILSKRSELASAKAERTAQDFAGQVTSAAEMVEALGMRRAVSQYWRVPRMQALQNAVAASDVADGFRALTRTLRLMLQSAMLGLGAWLAIRGQVTPGAMLAGSILLGRALTPIEALLTHWQMVQRGRQGWDNLCLLLDQVPFPQARTPLPKPKAHLVVQGITVAPPGARMATLRSLSFDVAPGQGLGVIGPSGAGKSTLARTLVGVWPTAAGTIRLDSAEIHQFGENEYGRHVGYLPQRVDLFDGTIAQNIARFEPDPDPEAVIAAARMAAAHEMILSLPKGYDSPVKQGRMQFSGGQMQRIGLARALYGEPVLLVLDEPNSNLDSAGSQALNDAVRQIKARGGAVLIMAHRPAAIQECDLLLMLDGGVATAFGPKASVLQDMVKNAQDIGVSSMGARGAA